MRFKNCLWKRAFGEIKLYSTRSGYYVKVDEETLQVLWDMCDKNEEELSTRQQEYYAKLRKHNMMEPGRGQIPEERSQSPLFNVDLEITAACNLKCKHCFATAAKRFFDFQDYLGLLEQFRQLGVITVTLNGGEPLLHPQIVAMLQKAREYHFRTELFTNATLVTAEFCSQLAPLGIYKVHVSLDGFQEHHEMTRGPGTYERTVQGIRLLRKHNIPVWINTLLHQANEDQMGAFQRFCLEELQVGGMKFAPVFPLGRARDHMQLFRYPRKTRDLLFEPPEYMPDAPELEGMIKCRASVASLHLTADGGVYPCSFFREAGVQLGNFKERPLSELYRAHLAADNVFTNFAYDKLIHCRRCPQFTACKGACRARALLLTGDLYGPDIPHCATRGIIDDPYAALEQQPPDG